jgi:low temperature requirement protein LtrA
MTTVAVVSPIAAEEERRTSYLELFFDLVFVFAITQVTGLLLRSALWAASLAVDLVGVLATGRENDWRVSPAHFAERYALIVIIALGESIVAIGVAAADLPRDFMFALSVTIAFAGVAALWWAYFGFVSGAVERALQRATESTRGPLARDVITLFHYPIVLGIV